MFLFLKKKIRRNARNNRFILKYTGIVYEFNSFVDKLNFDTKANIIIAESIKGQNIIYTISESVLPVYNYY